MFRWLRFTFFPWLLSPSVLFSKGGLRQLALRSWKRGGIEVSGAVLRQGKYEKLLFQDMIFDDCHFPESVLKGVAFKNCLFRHCSFRETEFSGGGFVSCQFEHSFFHSAKFDGTRISNTVFSLSEFEYCRFTNGDMSSILLRDCVVTLLSVKESNCSGISMFDSAVNVAAVSTQFSYVEAYDTEIVASGDESVSWCVQYNNPICYGAD